MRRADRLFQIVQYLRGRRVTTAAQLARWLQVSERTIYRDVQDLSLSGVPVEGEAGVGYRIDKSFDLPPLMFTLDEVEALVAGARMIEAWGGPHLATHARSALAKITLALPRHRRQEVERTRLFAPSFHVSASITSGLDAIRTALTERRKLLLTYRDRAGSPSERIVRPLGVYFWGTTWTLAAWCETKSDFRNFRLDRIITLTLSPETFVEEPGRSLDDLLARYRAAGS